MKKVAPLGGVAERPPPPPSFCNTTKEFIAVFVIIAQYVFMMP